jgi:hypothetical protein
MSKPIVFEIVEYANGKYEISTQNTLYAGIEGINYTNISEGSIYKTMQLIADVVNNRYGEGVAFVIG